MAGLEEQNAAARWAGWLIQADKHFDVYFQISIYRGVAGQYASLPPGGRCPARVYEGLRGG